MDADRLFGYVVRDLGDKLVADDEYQTLRASGLLRLLLIDQESLLDAVKRGRKVWFDVNDPYDFRIQTIPTGDAGATVLGSGTFGGEILVPNIGVRSRALSLSDFLTHPAADSSWTGKISVRLFIRATTVALGGVHFAEPRDLEDQVIAKILRYMTAQSDLGVLAHVLQQITAVTALAMTPLLADGDRIAVLDQLRAAGLRKLTPGDPAEPQPRGLNLGEQPEPGSY